MKARTLLGTFLASCVIVPVLPVEAQAPRPPALREVPVTPVRPGAPAVSAASTAPVPDPAGFSISDRARRASELAQDILRAETELAALLLASDPIGPVTAPTDRRAALARVGITSSTDLRSVATRARAAVDLLATGSTTAGVDGALAVLTRARRVAVAVFPGLPLELDGRAVALALDAAATQHDRLAVATHFEEMSTLVDDRVYLPHALPARDLAAALAPVGPEVAGFSRTRLEQVLRTLEVLRVQFLDVLDAVAVAVTGELTKVLVSSRVPTYVTLRERWAAAGHRRVSALLTALEQLGDPYQFAMRGPDSFDCSGLTSHAWFSGGAALRTSSFAQRSQTERPARGATLLPGDLVFYQRPGNGRDPVGHVALLLGVDDLIVEANQGAGMVRVAAYETGPLWGFGQMRLPGERSAGIALYLPPS